MDNLNINPNLESNKQANWFALFLRWFLGGLVGIGISAWIYFDFSTSANTIPTFFAMPFIGQYYLFAYLYLSTLLGDYVSQTVSYYIIIFSALIWGLIGALLASRERRQVIAGAILFALYIIVGYLSYMIYNLNLILSA